MAYFVGHAVASSQSGEYTDEMIKLMDQGNIDNMTEEDAERIIDVMERQANRPKSQKTEEWIKVMNSEENPIYGFLKATAQDPATALEISITSMAGQAKGLKSDILAKTAGAVGTAQAGATAYKTRVPILAVGGFLRGVMSTLGGGVEASSKFGEYIREEFDGEIPSEEELVEFLQDEEKYKKFRNKAILKGGTIALVDNIGGGIVQNSVYKTAKTGRKLKAATKGLIGESAVGGGGEALSSVVIGEKVDAADVGLEILGQGGQAVVDVGTALNPGKYTINKGRDLSLIHI